MKKFKIYILSVVIFLLFFSGCLISVTVNQTVPASPVPGTLKTIAAALLAVYEALVRLVPTVGDYSILSWIIRILKKMSDTLNIKSDIPR